MKMPAAFTVAFLVLATARAQEADPASVGVLPEQRQPVSVPAQERNPFSKQESKIIAATPEDDKESEENRIRRALTKLAVVGRTRDVAGSWKVMLGGLILEKGKNVPPVLPAQTEVLRVVEINDRSVELVWLDKSGEPDARRLAIPIDLAPHVHTVLAGPAETETPAPNEPQVITNRP
jgi:hypothetical protein